MTNADANSQWYPYPKVYKGFYNLSSTVEIPRKIMDYLLDMPDDKYTAPDDNTRSRVRLWKYLYYDGANPLDEKLPTPKQKRSVLFNPDEPTKAPTKKGYRLIPQIYIKPAQEMAQTRIYVYMGRTIPDSDFTLQLSIEFAIFTHYTQEANAKTMDAYSRCHAIEQCLIEALHGVNMAGVGAFYLDRTKNSACGSEVYTDKDSNVMRRLTFGLEIKSETKNAYPIYDNIPLGDGFM